MALVLWRDIGAILILAGAVAAFAWFILRERARRMEAAWPGRPIGFLRGVLLDSSTGEAEFIEGVPVETPFVNVPGFIRFFEDRLESYLKSLPEEEKRREKQRILSRLRQAGYHGGLGLKVKCYGFSSPRFLLITYGNGLDDPEVQRPIATPYVSRILGPLPSFFAIINPAYRLGDLAEPGGLLDRIPLLRDYIPYGSKSIPVYLGFPMDWNQVKTLSLDGETRRKLYTIIDLASEYANVAEIERENSVLREELDALSKAYEELKSTYGDVLADRDRLLRVLREEGTPEVQPLEIFTRTAFPVLAGLAGGWILLPRITGGDPGGGAFLGALLGLAASYFLVKRLKPEEV